MKGSTHVAALGRVRAGICLIGVAGLLCLGCFARAPGPLSELERSAPRDAELLRVRLHFGAEADLDLHVTDPQQETVYFGNNPSLGGGVLEEDLRCEQPAPRTEVVTFASPVRGRYRVGVDFASRCRRVRAPVPFELEVTHGEMILREIGEVAPGRFHHIALEFDLGDLRVSIRKSASEPENRGGNRSTVRK